MHRIETRKTLIAPNTCRTHGIARQRKTVTPEPDQQNLDAVKLAICSLPIAR
jgi:hypothetical protein